MELTNEQQDQVDALKALVGTTSLDDVQLWQILQDTGGRYAAASEVWMRKSAGYGDLVDVREGSSTRPLSQLRANAVAMSEKFAALAAGDDTGSTATSHSKIWRLSR